MTPDHPHGDGSSSYDSSSHDSSNSRDCNGAGDGVGIGAADQLAALERTRSRAAAGDLTAGSQNGLFLAGVGVVLGVLSAVVGLAVHRSPAVLIAAIVGYIVVLQALMAWWQKGKRGTRLGWTGTYRWALGTSLLLYSVGVFLAAFQIADGSVPVWIPFGVVVALPAAVTGLRDRQQEAR